MREETLSVDILKSLLVYNRETGELYWKARPLEMFGSKRACSVWNARYAGKPAFTHKREGYFVGAIFDRTYVAHRVIWKMETGEWPTEQIDHISGDRAGNKFENLREATHAENGKNQKMPFDNTSGFIGVYFHKQMQKWAAQIVVSGKKRSLGLHVKIESAVAARKAAEIAYGYHPNHGRAA